MEPDAAHKRTAILALGVLGALLIAVLVVFTAFSGDDEESGTAGSGTPAAGASQGAVGGSGTGGADGTGGGEQGVGPIIPLSEVADAHKVMVAYLAGSATYDHTSRAGSWVPPLLELTTDDMTMRQETALPSGKEWAVCKAAKCSSKGRATVERDALISDDVTRDSGQTISSVVKLTTTRTEGGSKSAETNSWLVSAKRVGGEWRVSGFSLFGLGNAGASDRTGE
ncbi:hypothetical protein ABZS86_02550 [Streptomyces sp. NPDC005355]|uniref:hypothetical protein n=1 Tax=Streptomyces sp. NPDC005355 TaxID=3157038 RepID=UPI0033A73091